MNRSRLMSRLAVGTAMSLAGLGVAVRPAGAATILEFDFRTAPNGSQQETGTSSVGSNVGQLVSHNGDGTGAYPTVNTGTAVGPGFVDPVAFGSVSYAGAISGSAEGMVTKNTAGVGHNNYWVDYFGSGNGMGTGSAIIVFKPHTTTHEGRGVFMSASIGDRGFFKLYDGNSSLNNGPRLDMNNASGVNVGNVGNWDPSKWYVLVASWKSNAAAYIYLEALSPSDPTIFSGAGGTVNQGLEGVGNDSFMSHPIAFNSPNNATGYYDLGTESFPFFTAVGPSETFDGDFALYRLTDQYTDSNAKFSAIVSSLIPEPTSAALIAVFAPCMIRRRRGR